MAYNTKLTPDQKQFLKEYKKSMPKNMAFTTVGGFTVLVKVMPNCVHVATALAGPDEKKIRRKVGEMYTVGRMENLEFVVLPIPHDSLGELTDPQEAAEYLARLLT